MITQKELISHGFRNTVTIGNLENLGNILPLAGEDSKEIRIYHGKELKPRKDFDRDRYYLFVRK